MRQVVPDILDSEEKGVPLRSIRSASFFLMGWRYHERKGMLHRAVMNDLIWGKQLRFPVSNMLWNSQADSIIIRIMGSASDSTACISSRCRRGRDHCAKYSRLMSSAGDFCCRCGLNMLFLSGRSIRSLYFASSIFATPHSGDCLFRFISALTRFPPGLPPVLH